MASFDIDVLVKHSVPINTDDKDAYPADIFAGVEGDEETARAMALFDAEHGDEPIETYATGSTVITAIVQGRGADALHFDLLGDLRTAAVLAHPGPGHSDAGGLMRVADRLEADMHLGGRNTRESVARVLRVVAAALRDTAAQATTAPSTPTTDAETATVPDIRTITLVDSAETRHDPVATALHYMSEHGGWLDTARMTDAEIEQTHAEDHHGPGSMRGHDLDLRTWARSKVEAVIVEHEEMVGAVLAVATGGTEPTVRLDTCPKCRHAAHGDGVCFNMASDNDCNCLGVAAQGGSR